MSSNSVRVARTGRIVAFGGAGSSQAESKAIATDAAIMVIALDIAEGAPMLPGVVQEDLNL